MGIEEFEEEYNFNGCIAGLNTDQESGRRPGSSCGTCICWCILNRSPCESSLLRSQASTYLQQFGTQGLSTLTFSARILHATRHAYMGQTTWLGSKHCHAST